MKRYNVNLQVTGYIEFEEAQADQPSLFEEKKDEKLSDAQRYYLLNNTNLPEGVVEEFTSEFAHQLIGKMKQKERERKMATELMKPIDSDQFYGESEAMIAFPTKVKLKERMKSMCKVELCGKKATVKGMCNKHYQIEHKKGKHAI